MAFADRTGLEPATSAVTGRHSNQLNYRSVSQIWEGKDSVGLFLLQIIFKQYMAFIYPALEEANSRIICNFDPYV